MRFRLSSWSLAASEDFNSAFSDLNRVRLAPSSKISAFRIYEFDYASNRAFSDIWNLNSKF